MSNPRNCLTEPVTIFEIVLDVCGNTFGQSPCTATGDPCYNTYETCKDKCNYTCATKSVWFSSCDVKLPTHFGIFNYSPSLTSISHDPTRLEIGKSFSTRGKITACFQDHPHNDDGFDPYRAERHVIPIRCADQLEGTLWGRLLARHKYFKYRRVNVYTGYCEQQLCEFDKQTYFIDKITGPDVNCRVCVTLKDPLILAETAQCPSPDPKLVAQQNLGTEFPLPFTLGAPLDGLPTDEQEADPYALIGQNLLSNNYLAGNEAQDKCFRRARHGCIDGEPVRLQGVLDSTLPAGWNLKLIERGVCGGQIGPHEGGATITLAETFSGHITDVICQLLDCMGLETMSVACCEDDPFCVIDWESFKEYRCKRPLDYISETVVCKGEKVKKLLDELSAQFLFSLYYNAEKGKIAIDAICPPECDQEFITITECDIVEGSFTEKESDTYYNVINYEHDVINCAEGIDSDNLGTQTITASGDVLLEECDRREWKARSVKTFESRWISSRNSFLAKTYGDRWLMFRQCEGKQVSFEFSNEYAKCLEFGSYVKICYPKLQGIHGQPAENFWLVKAKAPSEKCTRVTFERMPFDDQTAPCLNCDTECPSTVDFLEDCNDECRVLW